MAIRPLRHLISANDLASIIDDPNVRVIDTGWYIDNPSQGRKDYDEGHIPGAVYASLDEHLSGHIGAGRHPLPSPHAFGMALGELGIEPWNDVVVYDQRGGAIASRLWWMLTAQGHESVAVLDGGIQAWVAAGQSLEHGQMPDIPHPDAGQYPTIGWTGVVSRHDVAQRSMSVSVIDARSGERYRGEEEPIDLVAGHIPGALSVPLTDNLADDLTFLPKEVLAARVDDLGIDSGAVISQCGSGVTACHNILAMEIAGIERPALYVGSWSDWSVSGLPIATGGAP